MDDERFQQMEKRLNEQAEATQAMNKTLNKFIAIMGNQEVARNIAPPPPVSPPFVTTTLQASQPSRVKPGIPSNLMEIEHKDTPFSHPVSSIFHSLNQTSLTIRCASTGRYPISREDMWQASLSAFYVRNYGQERCALHHGGNSVSQTECRGIYRRVKDLVDLSGYTDPIAIVLKFR
jgi:hypothetical protein